VIKILQDSIVTQTVLGGLTVLQLPISYSIYVPMKVCWQQTKCIAIIKGLTFLVHPEYSGLASITGNA